MAVPNPLKYAFVSILPLLSAGTWLGMLLAMLIVWERQGHPHYASMSANQHIAYISDIGAQGLKPLFIAGCCVTTVFLDLSFASERWLRHTGRLARNLGVAEKVLSALSIIFAIAGTCGLILLSIFDTLHHPHLHDGFLLLFVAGYVISAIFICAEYQRLGIHFRQHWILRLSFWLKLMFIIVEVIFAIIFAATSFNSKQNVAAVFEWIVAFVFTFYVLTFFIDLLPAARSTQEHSNAELMHPKRAENVGATMNPAGPTNGMTANGVNGNAYAVGAAGHDDIGTRQHRARAAQNF
ncbi:Frag1/DRAM/Sfk1 family-domain-containing protein [Usnea florida]